MKTLKVTVLFSAFVLSGCTARPELPTPDASERFTGAWQLVSWESTFEGKSSFPFGKDAAGLLVYTANGRMSVFLSQPNREPFAEAEAKAGALPEKAAAFDSCFAYAGAYRVEENQVIHRIEHCTFPNWVGTEQVRYVRFDGDRLILETPPRRRIACQSAIQRVAFPAIRQGRHAKRLISELNDWPACSDPPCYT